MNRPTKLRQWLQKNKSFVKGKSDSRELTHLLMDGCKIHISQERHEEFLQIFAEDITYLSQEKKFNFISENRTPIFRFLVDIDYLDEYLLSAEDIETMGKNIQIALEPFLKNYLEMIYLLIMDYIMQIWELQIIIGFVVHVIM